MRTRRLLFSMLILAMSSRLDGLAADPAASVSLTITSSGLILVPVTIDGAGPFHFVLDTGSNRSAVSDRLAAQLLLPAVATTETVTTSGIGRAVVVRLAAIGIGPHTSTSVLAPVLPTGQLHAVHRDADGIIGQDILIDAHYTLDYKHRQLIWRGRDQVIAGGAHLTLRRTEGRLVVELPQDVRSQTPLSFVPDSGAEMLVLFEHQGHTTVEATVHGAQATTTISGEGHVRSALVSRLRIGRETLWDVPAMVTPSRDTGALIRIDGLLPLSHFSTVTFNGQAGYMTVTR